MMVCGREMTLRSEIISSGFLIGAHREHWFGGICTHGYVSGFRDQINANLSDIASNQ